MSADYGPLLRQALARIEELEAAAAHRREPIAVIGMACRFPGANNPEAYWRLLAEGVSAIGPVPDHRWPDDDTVVDAGGFIGSLRDFDTRFFGISGREAASLDPQQRLLLEVAWEAFEDAGIPGRAVPEGTGVFIGISNIDYRDGMTHEASVDGYFSSGATPSTASGRLAYFFGTRGPAMSIDTACSSSLVSVDLAVRHLRDGTCDLALVGGVNRIVTPYESRSLTTAGMLSPTGRCRPFDASADGYVRAEGGGLVVLKRASDVTDRDRVHGLILGTAVNQDGRSSGLTVPHGPSQQEVIRRALRDASVISDEVGYIEAHGTGTALGDPIEINALGAVFVGRPKPLRVGSVKSNIGHAESAAGIAGLIKALLMLRHRAIPPTLNLARLNPRIDWARVPIRVPSAAEPWPDGGRRIAGVSSYGFSGTNAHVVVAEPEPAGSSAPAPAGSPYVLPLSARAPRALTALVTAYRERLAAGADPADLSLTAAAGRSHFQWRQCAVGQSRDELVAALDRPAPSGPATHRPKTAFMFTGQGAQRPGMAAELFQTEPIFGDAIEECAAILDPILSVPLVSLLSGADGQVHETRFTQPALVAVGYALSRLWQEWGVRPDYVLGHSVGEYAAACVAGILSLPDALRLVAERGRLMQQCPPGVMFAVRCGVAQVEPFMAGLSRSAVAAVNGPESTVLAGDETQLRPVLDALAAQGVEHRRLTVSHAFHSPLLSDFAVPFGAYARQITYRTGAVPLVSNLTGSVVATVNADYWVEHALRPVQFFRGVQTLRDEGVDTLIELGPEPVLLGMAGQVWEGTRRLPSLRGGRERETMMDSLARLYEAGADIDWAAFERHRSVGRRFAAAPTYPFQRERHWALTGHHDRSAPGQVAPLGDLVQLTWTERSLPTGPARAFHGLVVGPDAGPLAEALRLTPGTSCRAERLQDVAAHLAATEGAAGPAAGHGAVTDVVYAVRPADGDPESTAAVCADLLTLTQVLASHPKPLRLVVITRGATDAPGAMADPGQSAVLGLIRTIQAEHPALGCLAVDLAGLADDMPEALSAELTAPGGHRVVLLDGTRRLQPRLEPLPTPAGPSWRPPTGAVLITGGLGALGLHLAHGLAAAGVRRLVLLGRSEPSNAARAAIRRLEDRGVDVRIVRGDVAGAQDVRRAIDAAGALGGVVHAAGVVDDGLLKDQTSERFAATLRAKVHGGMLLDQLSRPHKPEFFVAYSSLAAVLPTRSSGAYGAANAYLDGLMARRRSEGLPGLSISWGPWAGAGMAKGESAVHEAMGLRMIEPAAATATLLSLLAAGDAPAHVVVAPADWSRLRDAVGDACPAGMLDELTGASAGQAAERAAPTVRIEDARALREHVVSVLRAILRINGPVDYDEGFFDMGFDSLTVLEFRTRLQAGLGVTLPPTVAFKYPTVNRLVDRLRLDLGLAGVPEPSAGTSAGPSGAADAELDDLLAQVDRRLREIRPQ